MDAGIVADVDARLDNVERDHGVRILHAIESGSRAWGFPSPDSDYDCRFVYIRPVDDYVTLFPKRDVIETPLTEVFDVNGWDLAKALKLLMSGNAVIIEWLMSPIVYRTEVGFRDALLQVAGLAANRHRIGRHYLHLGRRIYETRLGSLDDIPIKKLFYALRPAIALRWMQRNPQTRLPPMNFPALCAGADLPPDLNDLIQDLLERKAHTRELGRGAMPDLIRTAILSEFDAAEKAFSVDCDETADASEAVDAFFRSCITRFAPRRRNVEEGTHG